MLHKKYQSNGFPKEQDKIG